MFNLKKMCIFALYLEKEVPSTCRFARSTTYQQARRKQLADTAGCSLWLCIGLWRSLQVDTETVRFFFSIITSYIDC